MKRYIKASSSLYDISGMFTPDRAGYSRIGQIWRSFLDSCGFDNYVSNYINHGRVIINVGGNIVDEATNIHQVNVDVGVLAGNVSMSARFYLYFQLDANMNVLKIFDADNITDMWEDVGEFTRDVPYADVRRNSAYTDTTVLSDYFDSREVSTVLSRRIVDIGVRAQEAEYEKNVHSKQRSKLNRSINKYFGYLYDSHGDDVDSAEMEIEHSWSNGDLPPCCKNIDYDEIQAMYRDWFYTNNPDKVEW